MPWARNDQRTKGLLSKALGKDGILTGTELKEVINIRLQPAETSRLQPSRRSVPGRALARPPVLRIINESGNVTCILVQWIGWM
jgi:hypothetical protein